MEEIWKDIKGYEGLYQISSFGRVKSLYRVVDKGKYGKNLLPERLLNLHYRNNYLQVALCKNSKYEHKYVHRLVAETFIPNINNFPQINHIDGNKQNNNMYNLEWCTQSHNLKEAYRLGLRNHVMCNLGKLGKLSKSSKEILQIDKNGNVINHFYGCYEAERFTGIQKTNINSCCRGKVKSAGGYIWKYA